MLKIDPDNIIGMYYYGKTFEKTEKYDEAEKMYKKVLSLNPAFEMALFDLAALYESRRNWIRRSKSTAIIWLQIPHG